MQENFQLLFQEIKQGNQFAFEKVFKGLYGPLCGFALGFIGDRDEAEELVQETFVKIWDKREELSVELSLKSYIYSSVRNACLNHLKHLKVRAEHAIEYKNTSSTATQIRETETEAAIQNALGKLPEKCKEVFELSRFEGLKYKDIAEQLGISIKTVENQMGKALKTLRVELAEFLGVVFILIITKFFGDGWG